MKHTPLGSISLTYVFFETCSVLRVCGRGLVLLGLDLVSTPVSTDGLTSRPEDSRGCSAAGCGACGDDVRAICHLQVRGRRVLLMSDVWRALNKK